MSGSPRDPRMDILDHRPDVYDHVEGPTDTPQHIVDIALKIQCPDCCVNVFVVKDETNPTGYRFDIAHDESCPWLKEHEQA